MSKVQVYAQLTGEKGRPDFAPVLDECHGDGRRGVTGQILADDGFRCQEDLDVEQDANDAQQKIQNVHPMDVGQVEGAGVNRLVVRPEGNRHDDKSHGRGGRNGGNDAAIGDRFLVPLVAGDGQVAVEGGHGQANQQDAIVDRAEENKDPAGQFVVIINNDQFQDAFQ